MDDDEEIPIEFIRQTADILGFDVDEDGNYRPPDLKKPVVIYRPKDIAKRVLQRFGSLHAVHLAYLRHAENRKVAEDVKRLARLAWAENPRLTIKDIAECIHSKLQKDGYSVEISTCRTHARAVRNELGLPRQKGRPRKNKVALKTE